MKKNALMVLLAVCGLVLMAVGIVLLLRVQQPLGAMRTLPYICIGVGCGVFGHGVGELLARLARNKNPERAQEIDIERKDERNIAIGNRAKAKAYDMMMFALAVLLLVFGLSDVGLLPIFLLLGTYWFLIGYKAYCHFKYAKEM